MRYLITFECGHDRVTQFEYSEAEAPHDVAYCTDCGRLKLIAKSLPISKILIDMDRNSG